MPAMKNLFFVCLCVLPLYAAPARSETKQSHAEIQKAALAFLQAKTQGATGQVSIKVDEVDRRISLPPCNNIEAFLPAGAPLLGRTSIGVRCNEKNGWSLFIQATITVTVNMLVSSKPLQQGQVLAAGDFTVQSGELGQPGTITDEAQALGKILKFSIGAGQLLKTDMLRTPYSIKQGQTVQILAEGAGFKLRTDGIAMGNAAEGQTVQVKAPSGQIISGIAKGNGTVEVRP